MDKGINYIFINFSSRNYFNNCMLDSNIKGKFMTEWSDAITAASGTALDDDHVFEYISLSKFETKKSEATRMSHLLFYMVLQLTLQLFLIYHQLIKSTRLWN